VTTGGSSAWGQRDWSEELCEALLMQLRTAFPTHAVMRHPSTAVLHPHHCFACEITEIMNAGLSVCLSVCLLVCVLLVNHVCLILYVCMTADMLVGVHGAGLTKEMFMPPGGLVVELSGHFNGDCCSLLD
jgi:hypothetical protein